MPIAPTDLIAYLSLNRPEDDVTTSGGGISVDHRPTFTQLTANALIAVISDGADTRVVTVRGRNAAGALVTDTITLTGAVEAVGTVTFERVLRVTVPTEDASRTVTVRQGAGGSTISTIPLNELGFQAMFIDSASSASPETRFEKFFWRNSHATLTLNAAKVRLSADPSSRMRQGIATTKNDTLSVANRKTTPGGITFVDDAVDQDVPGTTLEAASAIGVWMEQALLASDAPFRSTFTSQISGTTA